MSNTAVINSFLFRMHQDPTIMMLEDLAAITDSPWINFLLSLCDEDERIFSLSTDTINKGLEEFGGKKFSAQSENLGGKPISISYVKFNKKSDLTFFILRWS